MCLISVCFRRSRSKGKSEKPGVVFYRISMQGKRKDAGLMDDARTERIERNVNSDIYGVDEGVIQQNREKIVKQIRILYCIIEHRAKLGETHMPDDVAEDFRKVLAGDKEMRKIVERAKGDFPLRKDLVTVGREFRDDFKYVLSARGEEQSHKDKEPTSLNTGERAKSLQEYVFELTETFRREGRVSQARNFSSLMSSLLDFTGSKSTISSEHIPPEEAGPISPTAALSNEADISNEVIPLSFADIDACFVRAYAEWLKGKDIIDSTQSFYLRTLRSVLNKAHEDGLINVGTDWFKDVNTRIYIASDAADKAISRDVLKKIEELNLDSDEQLSLVRDMFMFGFYCEGMELVDVANLTPENVREGTLVFHRRQHGLERRVILGEEAKRIIRRYARKEQEYLFPLLDFVGPITFGAVRNYVRQCLTSIGKLAGFPRLTFTMNISTYKSLAAGINISELLLRHGKVV